MREEGELEWQSSENGIPELDENGLLVRDSKRGRIKGCERRRIHQTNCRRFSKHGSRPRRCPENGKSTGLPNKGKKSKSSRIVELQRLLELSVYGAQGLLKPDEKGDLDENNPKT